MIHLRKAYYCLPSDSTAANTAVIQELICVFEAVWDRKVIYIKYYPYYIFPSEKKKIYIILCHKLLIKHIELSF